MLKTHLRLTAYAVLNVKCIFCHSKFSEKKIIFLCHFQIIFKTAIKTNGLIPKMLNGRQNFSPNNIFPTALFLNNQWPVLQTHDDRK
jgi:hypothetical protein